MAYSGPGFVEKPTRWHHYADRRFCSECGAVMVYRVEVVGYEPYTREERIRTTARCSKWRWWNSFRHDWMQTDSRAQAR